MHPILPGDYVNVDGSSTASCASKGIASLIAALAQRTVMSEHYCHLSNGTHKRAIWLVFREEHCVEEVKQLFEGQKFSVVGSHSPLASYVDVPINLLTGAFNKILTDSQVGNIALLSLTGGASGGEKEEKDQQYKDSLHALFSLYRRVRINGYVVINNCFDYFKQGVDDFFIDGNHVLLSASTSSSSFMKNDTQVRIPL